MGGAHLTEEGKLKLDELIFFIIITYDTRKRIVVYNNLCSRGKSLVSVARNSK